MNKAFEVKFMTSGKMLIVTSSDNKMKQSVRVLDLCAVIVDSKRVVLFEHLYLYYK